MSLKTREERLSLKETRDISYDIFRRNIRILRNSLDISAVDLSAKLGLKSGARCIDLEYGRAGTPSIWEVDTISKFFNVSIDDLLYKKARIVFE